MEAPVSPPPAEVAVPTPGQEIVAPGEAPKAIDAPQPQQAPPPQPELSEAEIAAIAQKDAADIKEVREEIDDLKKVDPKPEDDREVVRMGSSQPHRTRRSNGSSKKSSSEGPVQGARKHPGIFDLHMDGGNREDDFGIPFSERHTGGVNKYPLKPGEEKPAENVDNLSLPGIVEGGYVGALANAFPSVEGRMPRPEEFWDEYRRHAGAYERAVMENPQIAAMVANKSELIDSIRSGKIAMVKSVEGLYVPANGKGLKTLERMVEDGVRSFGIMWNWENGIGTPQTAEASGSDPGLTDFGVDVVQQLAQIPGVFIDLSHSSAQTMEDVLKIVGSKSGKVIASHSGIRDVNMHPRNLPIEIAQAIGENGIIGVPLHNKFIKPEALRTVDGVKASSEDVVRRIVELRNYLGGSDHIGLGTDFGGTDSVATITGLDDSATFGEVLYDAMKKSGEFSEREIEGIFGKNALRYLDKTLPNR